MQESAFILFCQNSKCSRRQCTAQLCTPSLWQAWGLLLSPHGLARGLRCAARMQGSGVLADTGCWWVLLSVAVGPSSLAACRVMRILFHQAGLLLLQHLPPVGRRAGARHLPLPLLQRVQAGAGPGGRLLPLHAVQRLHEPQPLQHSHLQVRVQQHKHGGLTGRLWAPAGRLGHHSPLGIMLWVHLAA